MDTPIFYTALFVHLVSLITGFGSVIVIDVHGLLWILKKVNLETVTKVAKVTQKLIWLGWCGLIASGLVLITSKGYVDNLTMLKLFSVVMLGLNGIYLHFINKSLDPKKPDMPVITKFRIALASTISQLGWWSAIAIGFLHRHWQHRIDVPENPFAVMIGVVIGILAFAIIGESVLGRKKT